MARFIPRALRQASVAVASALVVLTGLGTAASAGVDDPWPPDPAGLDCGVGLWGNCDARDWYADMYGTDWSASAGLTSAGIVALAGPALRGADPSYIENLQAEADRFGWSEGWRQCVRKEIALTSYTIYEYDMRVGALVDYFDDVAEVLDDIDTPYNNLLFKYLELIEPGAALGVDVNARSLMDLFLIDVMLCDQAATGVRAGAWSAPTVTGPVLGSRDPSETATVAFSWDVPPVYRGASTDATLRMTTLHWSSSTWDSWNEQPYVVFRNYCYSSFTDSVKLGSYGIISNYRGRPSDLKGARPTATWDNGFLKGGCSGPHLSYDHTEIVDERAGNTVLATYYPQGHPLHP